MISSRSYVRSYSYSRLERGQAILELIPVAILLLTLTCGVIDFGRAVWQLGVITGLTREGSNLASRNSTLEAAASAVLSDGAALDLPDNGKVFITAVQNTGTTQPHFEIIDQYQTNSKNIKATSRIGSYTNGGTNAASLPTETTTIPQSKATVYVTEIYCTFSPITPIGLFVKDVFPSNALLYDVAYF